MRVLLISHTYIVAANHGKLRHLSSLGLDLMVVTPREWSSFVGEHRLSLAESLPYQVTQLNTSSATNPDRLWYHGLWSNIRQFQPDIVHVEHEPRSFALFQAILGTRLARPRSKVIFFTWENLLHPSQARLNTLCEYLNLRLSHCAIAGNNEAKDVLVRKGFMRPIYIIPQLGVELGSLPPTNHEGIKSRYGLDCFVIGYVGRLAHEKGLLTLLEAAAGLEGNWHLLLVGEGPLKEELKERCNALGLGKQLTFVDSVPHEGVIDYMQCMDVLVLPSITTDYWKEQFGHVLIEAMASGTPVIGSTSGAIPEVVGDSGLIFREGDPSELRARIAMLMGTLNIRAELAEKGIQRVAAYYTNERIAQVTYKVYQEVLSDS